MRCNSSIVSRKNRFRNRGLSLLELLCCVAIAVVLLAMLIPLYRSVTERSDRVVSISNLRQCVGLMRSIASDNNNIIQFTHKGAPWINVLWPRAYPGRKFPSWQADCSNLKGTFFYDPSVRADLARGNPVVRSYGLNVKLYTGHKKSLQIRLNNIEKPASTALLTTVGQGSNGAVSSNLSRDRINFRLNNYTQANVGFADGHVQSMTREELAVPVATYEDVFWRGRD